MVRSTSALLDTAAARSLLDRRTARAVRSRVGGPGGESDDLSDDPDEEQSPADADAGELPGTVVDVPKLGSFEVMNRTIDIAQAALARHTLAVYPPDLLIEVPRSTCRALEFHRAVEVIATGRALADDALDVLVVEDDQDAPPAIEH
jgi:NTE family protein